MINDPIKYKMMNEARISAYRIIAQTIRSVLTEAASEALRRILRERLDDTKKRKLDEDEDALDELPVFQRDIVRAYEVSTRLAERWEERLLENGEQEVASVVRNVLETGRFLEPNVIDEYPTPRTRDTRTSTQLGSNAISQSRDQNDLNGEVFKQMPMAMLLNLGWRWDLSQSMDEAFPSQNKPTGTHWKSLPKLNHHESKLYIPKATILPLEEIKAQQPQQLYGYPAPSIQLSYAHHSSSPIQSSRFLRDQIEAIDMMFGNADATNQPTSWYHGWSCIQRAADINRDRMHLQTITGRKRKDPKHGQQMILDDEFHQIIPKSMVVQNNLPETANNIHGPEVSIGNSIQQSTRRVEAEFTVVPVIQVIASKQRVANLLESKSQISTQETSSQIRQSQEKTGRPPCPLSSLSWTVEEISHEFSNEDKEKLNSVTIDDMEREYMNDAQSHRIVGALKHLGLIHLWEQTRSGDCEDALDGLDQSWLRDEGTNAQKKRTRVVKRARKMRLWPHTLEKVDKADSKGPKSKVIWSESFSNDGDVGHKYWMELDLGECMVQLKSCESGSWNDVAMAFRSLEISALVE